MKREDERQLVRLLAGELDAEEAGRLRRRLADEPELAAAWQRLEAAWRRLDLPPEAAAGGLGARVMARLGEEAGQRRLVSRLALWRAPAWAQAAGAAALAAGLALGVALGSGLAPPADPGPAFGTAPPAASTTAATTASTTAATAAAPPTATTSTAAADPAPAADTPAAAAAGDAGEDDDLAGYADFLVADGDTLSDAYLDALSAFGEEGS